MTELQWLIHMLTKQKLSAAVKDMFIERIGEVEATLVRAPGMVRPPIATQPIQAPSTQKLLEEAAYAPAPTIPQRVAIPTEVITSKGNGTMTRGPRKF
jgi:hypothetical protein